LSALVDAEEDIAIFHASEMVALLSATPRFEQRAPFTPAIREELLHHSPLLLSQFVLLITPAIIERR